MTSLQKVALVFSIIMIGMAFPAPEPFRKHQTASRFQNGDRYDILIKMSKDTSNVLQKVSQSQHSNRHQLLNSLHEQLVKHAEETQQKVLEYLSSKNLELNGNQQMKVRSFWATNQIYVKGATRQVIRDLLKRFSKEVQSVYPDQIVAEIQPVISRQGSTRSTVTDTKQEGLWGHERIQTREAWKELGILDGSSNTTLPEIRIATIDTGVRYTHEALRDNFVGDYGWFDPTIGEPFPEDRMGHGSHTTGTIAGSHGIGVAPWVKWMTCRGCPTLGCSLSDLLACGEFLVCPTLANGSSRDCSKAPHLISNSWSGGQGLDWYNDIIAVWHAAGIIPVFSIGNFGNAFCGTANYPGDLPDVIAVGSTTVNDTLSWFSSIGPTFIGGSLIKPDVVAPGSDILSATNTGDSAYELMSGTSMSAPMVSGIVALLLTKNPQITFEQARQAIVNTAQPDLQSTKLTCRGIPDTDFPNYVFGYGRANALQSIRFQA